MMFSNVLIATDLDGTLLDSNCNISEKNLLAIKEFRSLGGIFTIATGRSQQMTLPVVKEIGLTHPAIIFNGAALYDYNNDRFVWQCKIDVAAKEYIREIMMKFPSLSIEYLCGKDVYVVNKNYFEEEHLALGNVKPIECEVDDIPVSEGIKVLLIDTPSVISEVEKIVSSGIFPLVSCVRSAPQYLELLPLGHNKGTGLLKLIELCSLKDKFTVTMGDYLNDVELVENAHFGVAVENSHKALFSKANYATVSNDCDAFYHTLEYLKKNLKRLING